MTNFIHKLLFLITLIFYLTLFSCSVHYKKESITNNKQKYSYLLSVNDFIAPTYIVNRLNKDTHYDLLFVVTLPNNSRDSEFLKYNNYVSALLQDLKQNNIKYKYREIAEVRADLNRYEFDVYYKVMSKTEK